jgi:SAM-dependent methyltransferase
MTPSPSASPPAVPPPPVPATTPAAPTAPGNPTGRPPLRAEPGSFRDPCSRVYREGSRVLRALSPAGSTDFDRVAATRFFGDAMSTGDIVRTWRTDDPDLLADGWAGALEHELLPVVTYPYEWSFGMLQDAALLQLRLLRKGLSDGVACKDGTAYNVQFRGTRPVFADVGSFRPHRAGDPWPGYRQFCQTFLYPLLVASHLGVPFQPLLRGALDGIPPTTAARLLRGRHRLHRGVLPHVVVHARAERRYGDDGGRLTGQLAHAGLDARVIDNMAARLEALIGRLRPRGRDSHWTHYGGRPHYPRRALAAKDAFVAAALARYEPDTVVDLGCNDGRYARIAAASARTVVAADVDEAVVDRLYRSLREYGPPNVTPLVLDVADPSPGLGWLNRERAPFVQRVRCQLVLCLALVHHLAIGGNVPLPQVVDLLASFGAPVVVEVAGRSDPLVQRLLGAKRDVHDGYGIAAFERCAAARFDVARRLPILDGQRTLFELVPAGRGGEAAS